jgi:hypothetical protein
MTLNPLVIGPGLFQDSTNLHMVLFVYLQMLYGAVLDATTLAFDFSLVGIVNTTHRAAIDAQAHIAL